MTGLYGVIGKIGELMSHIDIEIPGHSIITQGYIFMTRFN